MTVDEENKKPNLFCLFGGFPIKKKPNFSKTGCQLMTATNKNNIKVILRVACIVLNDQHCYTIRRKQSVNTLLLKFRSNLVLLQSKNNCFSISQV
jgi:hypothetical protein